MSFSRRSRILTSRTKSLVLPTSDFVRDVRIRERRLNDIHAALVREDGTSVLVRRLNRNSFFPSMEHRPIYVSEEFVHRGDLLGVIETPPALVWILAARPEKAPKALSFMYQLWEGFLSWLDRLLPLIAESMSARRAAILHLHLALGNEIEWESVDQPGTPEPAVPVLQLDPDGRNATITVPFGFVSLLRRPTNDGERAL